MTSDEIADRLEIAEQLARYCRAVDRLDIPLGHSVFHENATADYGASLYRGDGRGVIDFICGSHLHALDHSHQIANSIVTFDGDADRAASETYFHSATRIDRAGTLIQISVWGRYLDSWSRRQDGIWRIDARHTLFDFDEMRDVATVTRSGDGRRDRSDPSLCPIDGAEMRNVEITISFDMRSPDWATPTNELYAAALDMAAFADRIGVQRIGLMEHHGSDDGYLPQPFLLASSMAAVTSRVEFIVGALILPLHEPVMVAEQIAVLDLISGGRFNVIFGAGYVPFEFATFGKSLKDRAKLMDSGIDTILRALKGERFEKAGRPVYVRPLPTRAPEDIIMVGGGVPASAKRAAKFGCGFGPMAGDLIPLYLEECARLGQAPKRYWRPKPGMPMSIHLCEDPEAGWKVIERHAIHVITEYAKWAEQEGDASSSPFKGLTDPTVLRHAGLFAAWTPEQLLAKVPDMEGGTTFGFHPLLGGLDPAEGWKSLRLLEQTMPALKAAIGGLG